MLTLNAACSAARRKRPFAGRGSRSERGCPADVTRHGEKNYRPYFSARWSNRDAGRPVNHAASGLLRRFVTRNFILIRGTLFALDSLIKYSRDPLLSLGLTGAEQVANSSSAFPSFDLGPPSNVGISLRGPWNASNGKTKSTAGRGVVRVPAVTGFSGRIREGERNIQRDSAQRHGGPITVTILHFTRPAVWLPTFFSPRAIPRSPLTAL